MNIDSIILEHVPTVMQLLALYLSLWLALCCLVSILYRRRSARLNARPLARTLGKILSARVEQDEVELLGVHGVAHELIVEYEYVVDGTPYRSKRIRTNGKSFGSGKKAGKALTGYSVGGLVEVWYAPEKPALSMLEGGRAHGHFAGHLFFYYALLFVVVELAALIGD